MSLNHRVVGVPGGPVERSWTSTDVMLYALAVGAGQIDAFDELRFTTENSHGVHLQTLPSFANMIGGGSGGGIGSLGDFDPASLLHAEQSFELHAPIPTEGTARTVSTVTGIYDKVKAALVVAESTSTSVSTGQKLATCRTSLYIRGEGGFGGDRGPSDEWLVHGGGPDLTLTMLTRPDQALLYRLTGDRNPLHSDPSFAAKAGFERPILHGMCTYGYTARALLHGVCGSDPNRFVSMRGRFSTPVFPGAELTVEAWIDGATAHFRTLCNGSVAIDRGVFTFKS